MSLPNTSLFPIFPLNLVLYPGMFLPLHIFEARYRAMVQYCLDNESPFGVTLIAEGLPEGDKAVVPCSTGTLAKIIQIQKTGPDRMNIWALGAERFELLNYHLSTDNYIVGQTRRLDNNSLDPVLYTSKMNQLNNAFRKYIDLLATLNSEDSQKINLELSAEPDVLSYQIAASLNVPLAEKQKLLEVSVEERLKTERLILEREINYLQDMLKSPREKTIKLPWGGDVNLN